MPRSNITSSLSRWVVRDGTPYSVEIFREKLIDDWTVVVIDAIDKTTVWRHTEHDDELALMGALAHLHAFTEPSHRRPTTRPMRLC